MKEARKQSQQNQKRKGRWGKKNGKKHKTLWKGRGARHLLLAPSFGWCQVVLHRDFMPLRKYFKF